MQIQLAYKGTLQTDHNYGSGLYDHCASLLLQWTPRLNRHTLGSMRKSDSFGQLRILNVRHLLQTLTSLFTCNWNKLKADSPVGGPLGSHTTTFYGCACNTRAWGSIPTSSLFISQPNYGGAGYCGGPICVPSANNNALATCQCSDWPVDNTLGPYTNNPCAGYTYTTTTTGTCSWQ